MFMGFCGLVPSEHSSGERTQRGGITHAGNTHLRTQLVESAWAYKARPATGATLTKRHVGLDPAVIARDRAATGGLSGSPCRALRGHSATARSPIRQRDR